MDWFKHIEPPAILLLGPVAGLMARIGLELWRSTDNPIASGALAGTCWSITLYFGVLIVRLAFRVGAAQ